MTYERNRQEKKRLFCIVNCKIRKREKTYDLSIYCSKAAIFCLFYKKKKEPTLVSQPYSMQSTASCYRPLLCACLLF